VFVQRGQCGAWRSTGGATPSGRSIVLASLLILAILGCTAQAEVSPAEWQRMTSDAKLLTVKSFLGGEVAADAKGGAGRTYPELPETYVERIDTLYRGGDQRTVSEIWKSLESN